MTVHSIEAAPFGLSVMPKPKPKTATNSNLGHWRTERLGFLKQTPEYQGLPTVVQRTIDHLIKRHEHPVNGAFPKQEKLAKAMGYSTRTIGKYLRMAVKAGVLTCTPQSRWGKHGNSLPNIYRVNSDLWENGFTEPQADIEVPNQVPSQVPTEAFQAFEAPTGAYEAHGALEDDETTHPEGVRQDTGVKSFGASISTHLTPSPFASPIDEDPYERARFWLAIQEARTAAGPSAVVRPGGPRW